MVYVSSQHLSVGNELMSLTRRRRKSVTDVDVRERSSYSKAGLGYNSHE